MKFDLPFHFNDEYATFIHHNEPHLYSIYYAATSNLPGDARIANSLLTKEVVAHYLRPLNVRKYMTLNGRMTSVLAYTDDAIKSAVDELHYLYYSHALDGLIVLDFYHLTMMVQAGLDLDLDIIPSINMGIDSVEKVNSVIQHITSLGFKVPSKIILDRGLNRNLSRLEEVVKSIRSDWDDIQIELLVNEGCIQHCPFKINHDILISSVNDKTPETQVVLHRAKTLGFDVSKVNEDFGCINHFKNSPENVLKIPFIRPEDIELYQPHFDIIKISSKVKSNVFVWRVFEAYLDRFWDGNLLDILDAVGAAAKDMYVFNDQLPKTFAKVLTSCGSRCHKCDYCPIVAKTSIQKLKENA